MELRGKVALVSGATGGLGAVIARALAAEGLHVALTYFSHREEGAALCREIEAGEQRLFSSNWTKMIPRPVRMRPRRR